MDVAMSNNQLESLAQPVEAAADRTDRRARRQVRHMPKSDRMRRTRGVKP